MIFTPRYQNVIDSWMEENKCNLTNQASKIKWELRKIDIFPVCSNTIRDAYKDWDKHSTQLRNFREATPDCYHSHKTPCTKQRHLANRHKAEFGNWPRREGQCCYSIQSVLPTPCWTTAAQEPCCIQRKRSTSTQNWEWIHSHTKLRVCNLQWSDRKQYGKSWPEAHLWDPHLDKGGQQWRARGIFGECSES